MIAHDVLLNFERFVAYHLCHGNKRLIRAIYSARTIAISNLKSDIMKASREARRFFYPIFKRY